MRELIEHRLTKTSQTLICIDTLPRKIVIRSGITEPRPETCLLNQGRSDPLKISRVR